VQPLIVTLVAVRALSFMIPPPPRRPSLSRTCTPVNVSEAEFHMPPARAPRPEYPSDTVRFEIDTGDASTKMSSTRSIRLAVMIVDVAPAPVIVTGPSRSRSPVAARSSLPPASESVNVPAGIEIASAPLWALASCTAARSVHTAPAVAQTLLPGFASTASVVLVTVYVVAPAMLASARHPTTTPRRTVAGQLHARCWGLKVFMGVETKLDL
jgi:hypothetical protein